jgi:hypothetical protein
MKEVRIKMKLYKMWRDIEILEDKASRAIQRSWRSFVVKEAFKAANGVLEWFRLTTQSRGLAKQFRKVMLGHHLLLDIVPAYCTHYYAHLTAGIMGSHWLASMTNNAAATCIQREYKRRIAYKEATRILREKMLAELRAQKAYQAMLNAKATAIQSRQRAFVQRKEYIYRRTVRRVATATSDFLCDCGPYARSAWLEWERSHSFLGELHVTS